MIHATSEQKAEKGASYLDSVWPGWESQIDTTILDVKNGEDCPLGQLYGSYYDALEALGLYTLECERMGFVHVGLGEPMYGEYERLTAAWKAEVNARRWKEAVNRMVDGIDTLALGQAMGRLSVMEAVN